MGEIGSCKVAEKSGELVSSELKSCKLFSRWEGELMFAERPHYNFEDFEKFHYQENIQFLRQARGSLQELIDDMNICLDEKYLSEDTVLPLKDDAFLLLKKINGYIAYLRDKKNQEES